MGRYTPTPPPPDHHRYHHFFEYVHSGESCPSYCKFWGFVEGLKSLGKFYKMIMDFFRTWKVLENRFVFHSAIKMLWTVMLCYIITSCEELFKFSFNLKFSLALFLRYVWFGKCESKAPYEPCIQCTFISLRISLSFGDL